MKILEESDNMTYIYLHIEYQNKKDKNALYYDYRKMNRVAITSSSLSIIPNKFLSHAQRCDTSLASFHQHPRLL